MFWLVRISLRHFLRINQVQLDRARLPFAQREIPRPVGENALG